MSLDLRGHGTSVFKNGARIQPEPAWRTSAHEFPPDIEPALNWLKSQPRIDSRKIAVIGYDTGANLALIASGRFKEIRGVIAVKPDLAESLAMAGSAQDFRPRSALVVTPAGAAEAPWRSSIAEPSRVLAAPPISGGAAAWFESAPVFDAMIQWLKETL
jgi:acetyl esterase/lipase